MSDRPLTKTGANKAGQRIAESEEPSTGDIEIVGRWRDAHLPALEAALDVLCQVTGGDPAYVLAGRLKKFPTIVDKLKRKKGNDRHQLKNMGDIAGCRIIVKDLHSQEEMRDRILALPQFSPDRLHDYVEEPRPSGYTAIHAYGDFEVPQLDKPLSVEVQIRTVKQHLWATSVEIYDSLMGTRLKFGSSDDFSAVMFCLLSYILNLRDMEDESMLSEDNLSEFEDVVTRASNLLNSNSGILDRLMAADDSFFVLPTPPHSEGDLFLLDANFGEQLVSLTPVPRNQAVDKYKKIESQYEKPECKLERHDVVLVSTDDIKQLESAYPNYFMDASAFVNLLTSIVNGGE